MAEGNIKQTIEEFEKVASVLFGQMRTAGLDRIQREAARTHVSGIAYLVELLGGTERAERVLTKGLEAIN